MLCVRNSTSLQQPLLKLSHLNFKKVRIVSTGLPIYNQTLVGPQVEGPFPFLTH